MRISRACAYRATFCSPAAATCPSSCRSTGARGTRAFRAHRGRERCNDYSIGIELEGTDDRPYTKPQCNKLVDVLTVLLRHYPRLSLADVVGHSEIAQGRKTDPGPAFDWPRLYGALGR